jgi:hypothetical protein
MSCSSSRSHPARSFLPRQSWLRQAQPDLRVQSSPQIRARSVMVGRSMTFYTEITNVGSGMAVITPQAFTGDGAADYLLQASGSEHLAGWSERHP